MNVTKWLKSSLPCAVAMVLLLCTPICAKVSRDALRLLATTKNGDGQAAAQQAWRAVVETAGPADLVDILMAMKDTDPVTENWLRGAVDAIAERELQAGHELPAGELEKFILDDQQSPRARRLSYEWLTKVEKDASERLLPDMLDDPSLELRYDAIGRVLMGAKFMGGDENKLKAYQRVLRSARDKGQLRECAEALEALGEKPNMAEAMGFLIDWKVLGPFDNTDRKGFNKIHLAADTVDLSAEYDGKSSKVKWTEATPEQQDLDDVGKVDLNEALVEEKNVLAYAVTTFHAKSDTAAQCRYDSPGATKLWVNGKEVAVHNVYHSGSELDQHIVPVALKAGANQILLKVCQNEQTEPWTKPWEFRLRVTDAIGGAIPQAAR